MCESEKGRKIKESSVEIETCALPLWTVEDLSGCVGRACIHVYII